MLIPWDNGGQDYPMPFKWAQKLASQYHDLFGPLTFSMGRAGSYLYGIDIDDCIKQSFILKDLIVFLRETLYLLSPSLVDDLSVTILRQ